MFSQEMINSSSESTRRSPRIVSNKNIIKTPLDDSEIFNVEYENFESVSRIIKPSSSALIPPWIRSSLGVNEKSSLGSKVGGNPSKFLIRSKETIQNVFPVEKLASFEESNILLSEDFEDSDQVKSFVEVSIKQETDFTENSSYSIPGETISMVLTKPNIKESENPNQPPHERKNKLIRSEKTSIDVVMAVRPDEIQSQKLMEDDKKKTKTHKQKIKTKKRSYDEHKSEDVVKSDLDVMLEKKAREILEKFLLKKEMMALHSEDPDQKHVLPNGKIKDDIKIGDDDLQILKELKEQIGSKDNVEKVVENVKSSDSKMKKKEDGKHVCERHKSKSGHDEKDKEKDKDKDKDKEKDKDKSKTSQQVIKPAEDVSKDMLLSADEENDIKRFSEFLSKNKSFEEKRKCLEEVRTYFEKKRWSQVERQVKKAETQSSPVLTNKKESKTKEKDVNENSEEIVEKAVGETLQKFTELYRFQIPGTVIDDMKKSIVETIKSENQEPSNRKNLEGISLIFELKDGFDNGKNSSLSLIDSRFNCTPNGVPSTIPIESNEINVLADEIKDNSKDNVKKNPFKTVIENKSEKSSKEVNVVENEYIKELRNEFERCLEVIQAQVDIAGSKLHSVVFEKADGDVFTRKAKLVYNCSKEGDPLHITYEGDKPLKSEPSKKSIRTQTIDDMKKKSVTENSVQTSDKKMIKVSTQTEWPNDMAKIIRSPEGDHEEKKQTENDKIITNILETKEQLVTKKSKELSLSDKGILSKKSKKLDRSIKSDCLGVNKQPQRQVEHKKRSGDVTAVNYIFLKQEPPITEHIFAPQAKTLMDGDVTVDREDVPKGNEDSICTWLWNGKKIDPGIDLKIQVEELMKEKLKEFIESKKESDVVEKVCSCGKSNCTCRLVIGGTSTEGFSTSVSSSERNLEVRKVDGKFCFSTSLNSEGNEEPFVFTAESRSSEENEDEIKPPDKINYEREKTIVITPSEITKKEFREIGTQNSQREVGTQNSHQTFLSKLNFPRLATNSKGKIHRLKHKKPRSVKSSKSDHQSQEELEPDSPRSVAVAKKVSETKKAKLEVVTKENDLSNDADSSLTFSAHDDPFLSNTSSTATSEDMVDKLRSDGQDILAKLCSKIKMKEKEEVDMTKMNKCEDLTDLKQWDLIENVLSRVNQKEKESLWNDIREFVKTKIGRDINDEGAKEVCIEIEQDIPKHKKGKGNQTIVAKGNYSPNEGDVEVEVDLTLDDLERILRHRQKKLKKRQAASTRCDSKPSSTSLEEVQRYQTFLNSVKALGGEYITESELKILKDNKN